MGFRTPVSTFLQKGLPVEIDSQKVGVGDLVARVERAGYGVATGEANLMIRRLSDDKRRA